MTFVPGSGGQDGVPYLQHAYGYGSQFQVSLVPGLRPRPSGSFSARPSFAGWAGPSLTSWAGAD